MRPVSLHDDRIEALHRYRSWTAIEHAIEGFRGESWSGRRNKLKALREALREGSQAVNQFRAKYLFNADDDVPYLLPELPNISDDLYRESGYHDGRCMYFDAIEALDWFIALDNTG